MTYFQATWLPATAYSLLAVVSPTTFSVGSHTWQCTQAGTSGGTEPAWPDPTLGTTTITDGTVVWSVGTGFRQSLQAGIAAVVGAFAAANPTIIRSVRTVRPRSFTTAELPCFFIGSMDETIEHSVGIRTRTFGGLVCYWVDELTEQIESNDRANFAADVLADLFTANFHGAGAPSGLQQIGTTETEFNEGGVIYPALMFTFAPNTAIAEGRN
jgi:hypothetical protein